MPLMFKKSSEGSTSQLLQLCFGYFVFYVLTGLSVKYFQGPASAGFPGLNGMQYLFYSTSGGAIVCMAVAIGAGWLRLKSNRQIKWAGISFPMEYLYIVPSGLCTAVVIPTTTLLYSLPISVMVAMVMMRGSIIVISRLVDEIQIRQGLLKKKVYREENISMIFALLAVSAQMINLKPGSFDFFHSPVAMGIFSSYILAYFIRIYIMNYFKNTRGAGVPLDNKGFFGIEQLSSLIFMALGTIIAFYAPILLGLQNQALSQLHEAILNPPTNWLAALASGIPFGVVAFFSVFILMYKGRTATFAGLVNRLTSLVAGTFSTVLCAICFGGSIPAIQDWICLGLILVAITFLARAEKRRAIELLATA